jgi:DNA-dependent RNA polymerase auxiliary subunit epsilon
MDKKLLIIGVLLIAIVFISGCAVSNYIEPEEEEKAMDNFSLLTEKEFYEENADEVPVEEVTGDVIEEIEAEEEVEEETFDEGAYDFVIEVKENELVRLKPEANDPDEDVIEYTFTEPLDENGEWQTNYGDAGQYPVTVTATDGKLITAKEVLIIVERVNVPPVIEDIGNEMVVDEGETLRLSPKIYDPNGDDFDVTISEPVGDDGVWEIDYMSAGDYTIKITANDGELESEHSIELTVKKKNVAPMIEDIDDVEIDEGDTLTLEPAVTDLNGDDVTVTISEPVGDDGEWEIGYTEAGEYEVTIVADDGQATTTKTVKITVYDVNMPPDIIDIINVGSGAKSAEEGEE